MKVLVDTPIWSLALQRRRRELDAEEQRLTQHLTELIKDDLVVMIGPIRQELLSGIESPAAFKRLRKRLGEYRDEPLTAEDYELAAQIGNECRATGYPGSEIDFLICAVTVRRELAIFTTDRGLLTLCHDYSGDGDRRSVGSKAGAIVAGAAHQRPRSKRRLSRSVATARRRGRK